MLVGMSLCSLIAWIMRVWTAFVKRVLQAPIFAPGSK